MAIITVTKISENQLMKFRVVVEEGDSKTEHTVSLNRADYMAITRRAVPPELLLQKSFEFLLEREPKEKILKEFDFTAIGRFFPEFKHEIQKMTGVI